MLSSANDDVLSSQPPCSPKAEASLDAFVDGGFPKRLPRCEFGGPRVEARKIDNSEATSVAELTSQI